MELLRIFIKPRIGSLVFGLLGSVASLTLTSPAALAGTISDILTITRPGFPVQVLTITEEDEASGSTMVTTTFLADAGTYCTQANCAFDMKSNFDLFEPPAISDLVTAKVSFFSASFDLVTLTMGSDADAEGGVPDRGSGGSDGTDLLFTKHPVGFSVVAVSDVPEPATIGFVATGGGAVALLVWRRRRKQ